MIGRADIEGSKSDVDMNSWSPRISYPCGNFSDTSSWKSQRVRIDRPCVSICSPYWRLQSSESFSCQSTADFWSAWARLRTPALSFNRYAAPAKLPIWQMSRNKTPARPQGSNGWCSSHHGWVLRRPEGKRKQASSSECRSKNPKPWRLPAKDWEKPLVSSFDKWSNVPSGGISFVLALPPLLHLRCRRTEPDWSQTQQGLLSPLSPSSPFPWLSFR